MTLTAPSTTAPSTTAQALLITGTVGAGKTTVADAVGDLLSASRRLDLTGSNAVRRT